MHEPAPYKPKNPVRIISAAALFDGHDAAINVMRRILQATGCEIIHLGHNRSVEEVAMAAVQEDAQGIALTSYQGGHVEYFKYLRERLDALGAKHTRIVGGGGGVIVPREIEELHRFGIDRIFSPEDGRNMGLQGMINMVVERCDFSTTQALPEGAGEWMQLARTITRVENGELSAASLPAPKKLAPVIGLTGTGGAGKSSLTDELVRRFLHDFPEKKVAVLCIDPTKKKTGGALLGDRIRMNSLKSPRAYMRSMATRGSGSEISDAAKNALAALQSHGFDLIFVETAGIGQGDSEIVDISDVSLYVMTAEYGAPSQLEKIEMLDHADFVAINKFTRRGSLDAIRDVRRQIQRNRKLWDTKAESLMVFGTSAAHFNDNGVSALYAHLVEHMNAKFALGWSSKVQATSHRTTDTNQQIIGQGRERYLSEISDACREYDQWAREQVGLADDVAALARASELLGGPKTWFVPFGEATIEASTTRAQDLMREHDVKLLRMDAYCRDLLKDWSSWASRYRADKFEYQVRGKTIAVDAKRETLSELKVPKVALPRSQSAGDGLYWRLKENVPGEFPYTAGTFPFKRQGEDPTRMFAGEGPSERTNERFHLLAEGQPAARLSTAFDSITLYGEEPHERPDIYGKIGESGVSIFTVEEAEQLYAGFDLCAPATSVSMTINGPAPTVLAFYVNTAIRQQCRRFLREKGRLSITKEQELHPDRLRGAVWSEVRALLTGEEFAAIRSHTLKQVRGTVQADILKEDQGQNTCIFSTEFALRAMGDVQQFFIDEDVRNFYSVSISGYHIAEAGANPIHQLAYTLSNGFTYVEYYRSRGMDVNDFAPNLSFFFSNGMDPEYTVIGRVARRIWAVAMKRLYGADARSQMLKYHIQTSGRSLHAMEIQFNDIRTTLQALLATYDNAQSLHTNAYDEAITTPTEESVRRALAIQQIINKEFGMVFCENATQGSFLVEELTDMVEAAVLAEFDRLTDRGGVLGAMERQYQRGQIQDDSMKYEHLKHSGALPIVGVNTFLAKNAGESSIPKEIEIRRASTEEKSECIRRLRSFQETHQHEAKAALARLQQVALTNGNLFAELILATEHCSLGQITNALYEVGGEYRRNL
jgi:methylmalonyl-CoA mutase